MANASAKDVSPEPRTVSLAKQLAHELLAQGASAAGAPRLRLLRGPALEPCILPQPPGLLHIGRGEGATWRVDDPSVSREQCTIECTPYGVFVVDTSRRGTQVGGVVVTERTGPLIAGQTISFGNVVLVYEDDAALAPLPASAIATLVPTLDATPPRRTPARGAARQGALVWWWVAIALVLAAALWVALG